jgi:membrane-anchored protein YejM (alkaline phosphatase superfamily)
MFLTSSHSPYRYPAEYARFRPLPAVEGGYVLDKMADAAPYKNDYHNSLFYIDSLLGKIFARLQADGTLERTWVVITGDHAEEFNENGSGYWGHGSNFTRWQTHTPLIVRPPGMTSGRVETRTSLHQDIVPTLMQDVLKCSNARETYSNGANLFALPPTRATILSSYFVNAYWVDGVVYEKMSGNKYSWDDIRQSKSSPDAAAIKALLKEETRFIAPSDRMGQQLAAKPGAD